MADPTKLVPWTTVEGDPRWEEAPTYLRDEYLAKWEDFNKSQVADDPALVKRITDHAASIRNELYPSEPTITDRTREGTQTLLDAGADVGRIAQLASPADMGTVASVAGDRSAAVRANRLKIVDDLNKELQAGGFPHSVKLTTDNGDGIMRLEAPQMYPEEAQDNPELDISPEVRAIVDRAADKMRAENMKLVRMGTFKMPSGLKEEYRDLPMDATLVNQFMGSGMQQAAGAYGLVRSLFGGKQGNIEQNLAQFGANLKQVAQQSEGAASSIARGAGTFGALAAGMPAGWGGLVTGALRGAGEAYEDVLAQTGDESEARLAAAKTAPGLLLFLGAGKLAAGLASRFAGKEATALSQALYGTAGATVANIGTSGVLRALEAPEGQAWEAAKPTAETLTVDTLFALMHGYGEYGAATQKARARAAEELIRRGFEQDQINQPPAEAAEPTPAEQVFTPRPVNETAAPSERPVEPTREAQPVSEAASVPAPEAPAAPTEGRVEPATPVSPTEIPGIRNDGVTEFPNDPVKFYSFTDSESIPGKAVSITIESETPPTPDQVKTAMDAKLRQFRESEAPADESAPTGLNKEANDLLTSIDEGGAAPAFISNNLRKIAAENGVTITDQMRPEDVIGELRKRASTGPEPEAPKPTEPSTEAAPPQPPVEPPKAAPTPAAEIPEGATSIKNAQVDQERAKRGMPAAMEPLKRTFGDSWDMAMREIEATPGKQDGLIAELEKKPRAINDVEDALLLHRQVELQTAYDRAAKDMADASDAGDATKLQEAQSRLGFATDALYKVYEIGKRVGTETGRGLSARRMLAKQDFTVASMLNRKRASKGGEKLSKEEMEKITEQADRIQKTDTAFEERKAELEAEHSSKGVEDVIKSASEPVAQDPAVKPLLERITAYLDNRANAARIRLRSKLSQAGSAPDPTILVDVVDIAASKLAKKGVEFASWSAEMVREFGEGIRDYLQPAWQQASQQIDKAVEAVIEPAKRAKAKRAVKAPLDATAQASKIDAAIGEQVKEGDTIEQLGGFVRRLAESFVKQGVNQREPLIDAVHGVLQKHFPGVSRRDAMDAISGYGKFTPLSKDPVKVQLRDLSGQMQQVAKLEDIRAKVPLQKTGKEQRTKSREEARLEREVEEAKKRYGVVVTDPETQLKSTMDGVKTRLRNQIRDIAYELETGDVSGAKEPILLDSEATALRALRDRLRSTLREIEGPKEMTNEQRVKAAERALEDSIASYEQRIRDNELSKPRGKTEVTSPRIEELKVQRDALKAQLDELRTNDAVLAEERKAERLVKSIERAEQELAGGTAERSAMQGPETQLVAEAREQLAGLREQIRQRNASSPEAIAAKQERAEAALEKGILELDRRIRDEDFTAKRTNTTPDSPRMEQLKAERASMRKLYMELKDAGKPKLSREEIAMKALKSRLASQTADLRSRASRGDFERPTREPLDITKDVEAMRLKAENTKAKEEFEEGRMKDEWNRMGKLEKAYAIGKETLNLPRAVLSSFDVSGLGRQGGFLAMAHPRIAKGAAKEMFKSLVSETDFKKAHEEIVNRPNAPLYDRSGLYIAPASEGRLSKMEEAIMSKFASKVPGVHASNRAYITVLNKLRADSFDQLKARLESKGAPMTQKELEAIANYVNVATGRGNLGSLAKYAEGLATIFFSPRLMASRFQLLLGQPLWRGSARTRKLIAQEYARALGGYGVIASLGLLAGATMEDDPKSSDFGKLKFGNTRVDFLSGLVQPAVLLAREATGEKTTLGGETVPIAGDDIPYKGDTRLSTALKYARSKLSPVAGTIVDIGNNWQDYRGKPVTPGGAALNLVTPLPFRDIQNVMEDQGIPKGTALYLLSLLGAGLQVHKDD